MRLQFVVPTESQGLFTIVPETGTAVAANLNPETAWRKLALAIVNADDPLAGNPYLETVA